MNTSCVYELRKPSRIEQGKKYPVLFIFHGIGSNEQSMFSLIEGLEEEFYVFSVRGPIEQPPGYAYFTIQGYGQPHREIFDQGIDNLADFINYAIEKYDLDREQLYLLGFSQGAIVSMALGLILGERIKGIVALSGYIPTFVKEEYKTKPVNNISLYISHGEFDNILPYKWGLESKKYFDELGASVTFRSYPVIHAVSNENQIDFKNWLLDDLSNNNKG